MKFTIKEKVFAIIWFGFIWVMYLFDLLYDLQFFLFGIVPIILYILTKLITMKQTDKNGETSCPNCSTLCKYDAKFCTNCGKEINPTEITIITVCDKCGKKYPDETKYCPDDGTKLTKQETEISQQSNKLITSNNVKIEPQIQKSEIDSQNKNIGDDEESGFFWDSVWIVMSIIYGSLLCYIYFNEINLIKSTPVLGDAILFFISAYGIYKRTILGLRITYFAIWGNFAFWIGFLFILKVNILIIICFLLIHLIWTVYFYNRRHLFK